MPAASALHSLALHALTASAWKPVSCRLVEGDCCTQPWLMQLQLPRVPAAAGLGEYAGSESLPKALVALGQEPGSGRQ